MPPTVLHIIISFDFTIDKLCKQRILTYILFHIIHRICFQYSGISQYSFTTVYIGFR